MNDKKKQLLFYSLFAILLLCVIVQSLNISKLNKQIRKRDSLIIQINTSDSIEKSNREKQDSAFSKIYTTDSFKHSLYEIAGSYNEIIESVNQIVEERDRLSDSLNIYKTALDMVGEKYNIKINLQGSKDTTFLSVKSPQMDTALFLLNSFRNAISFDTETKKWIIDRSKIK